MNANIYNLQTRLNYAKDFTPHKALYYEALIKEAKREALFNELCDEAGFNAKEARKDGLTVADLKEYLNGEDWQRDC